MPEGRPGLATRTDASPVPLGMGSTESGVTPKLEQTVDRAKKEKVVEELGQIFESSGVVVVCRYEGLTVAEMQDLRARMRAAGGAVRVAKNRLAKIALEGKACAGLAQYLTGMTALAFSKDPVAAAKVVDEFAKVNKKIEILGGAMGRAILTADGVRAVAQMPSREELIAEVVACIGAPAAQLAAALAAPASAIAGILKTLEERQAA